MVDDSARALRRSRRWRNALVPGAAAAVLFGGTALSAVAAPTVDPASYVNPFVGTQDGGPDFGHGGGAGMTFPGAVLPFGMMQWSPDTVRTAGGGYKYEDTRLRGFSMSHISGPGCLGAQDFPVIPISGRIRRSPAAHGDEYVQTFSHANEEASPGYYAVTTDSGVRTELTATTRGGIARFTFPTGKPATLLLNVTGSVNGVDAAEARIDGGTVSGWARTGGFCGTRSRYGVYFRAAFDRSFTGYGTWRNEAVRPGTVRVAGSSSRLPPRRRPVLQGEGGTSAELRAYGAHRSLAEVRARSRGRTVIDPGRGAGVYLQFDGRTPVQMRVAVSYVSLDGARRNLAAEVGGANFDAVRKAARRTWNGRLGQVAVSGGSKDERRTFFTALYHALLQPYVFDDVDRRYAGFDGRTHRVRPGHHHYATFSGWDIYRSEVQLLAFLAPDIASDVAQSLYDNAHAIGDVWDRWSHNNTITGVMNGDPYHSIVASVYAFGARQFAARAALASMVRGAERIGPDPATGYEERPGNADYLRRGYVPGDVSTTLEYGVADFGIAQLAQRLGNAPVHRTFMRRAQAWENVFNPANRWIQPRFADGSFLAPFDPADPTEYVEGNGAQYHWMVPHDVAALVSSMGGRQVVTRRLDHFFSQFNAGPRAPYAYLGNQPSLLSPWLYTWTGAPWRTQDTVRRAQRLLYKPTPDGLVGNDDLGTMSAWYVWASLGMYPAIPGRAELVLNSPLFPRTVVRRSSGQVVTISAPQASPARRYVQAVSVNGKPISRAWLPETFVASGGRLDFRLSTSPDRRFGSDPSDAPPSFGEGRNRLVVTPGFVRVQPGDAVSAPSRAADAP